MEQWRCADLEAFHKAFERKTVKLKSCGNWVLTPKLSTKLSNGACFKSVQMTLQRANPEAFH